MMADVNNAESAREAVASLSSRLEATLRLWRAQLHDDALAGAAPTAGRHAVTDIAAAQADLRGHLVEIRHEIAVIEADARQEAEAATAWELRAMKAINRGEDHAAIRMLEQHGRHLEALAAMDDDLGLLRGMAEACRHALGDADQ